MRHQRKRAKRVSAGGVEAWRAALTEMRRQRRDLLFAPPVFVGLLVVVNLPWIPAYERGLLSGVVIVGTLWLVTWLIWVISGLSLRLNGVWAEQAISDQLASAPKIYGVVPSFKFDHYDIDTVAVTRGGVLAVETKWHLGEVREGYLDRAVHQAAAACRSLRHELAREELSSDSIKPVVVLCGPKARDMPIAVRQVQVDSVAEVTVVGAAHLEDWLDKQRGGHVGPDFAARILRDLKTLAVGRDRTAVKARWAIRRLARIR